MSINKMLSGIPLIGGLFDDSDDQALQQLAKNQGLFNGISLPDLQKYNPEQYQYAGDYAPDKAQATEISEDPMVRSAQLSALSKMAGLSDTGLTEADQANYEKARQMAGQISHSGTGAALQNAQARGVGGSGLEFLMREQAGQDAANQAQTAGLQQAADSARQKALYSQAYEQGMSGLRGQDLSANSANANILNSFNMANTNVANQAQQYNLANKQNISNMNTAGANQAQQYNNQMAQQGFQNQMGRAQGIAGVNNSMAQGYAAENAANTAGRNANTSLGLGVGALAGANGVGPLSFLQPDKKKAASGSLAGEAYDSPFANV